MSDYLIVQGEVSPASSARVLGSFEHQVQCAPASIDISDAINAQVGAVRGDAMAGFTVRFEGGDDCLDIHFSGTIVAVNP